jgi:tape measure domain-containing protein
VAGPIDIAYIALEPDLTRFDSELKNGVGSAFDQTERVASTMVQQLERLFGEMSDQIIVEVDTLTRSVDDGFDNMTRSAANSADMMSGDFRDVGDQISLALRDAAMQSERQLEQISASAQQSAGKTESSFKEAGSGMSSFMSTTLGFFAGNALMSGVSQAFNFAKTAVFGFNAQLQNAQIAFTTMLGSGQKAQVFLNQLKDFAKTTPFQFTDLVTSAQQMLGMGIASKSIIPDLTALGDAVASVGGGQDQIHQVTLAFDQMSAKGKLDMGNMEQLMQGGVANALQILADKSHVTTGQMIEMISSGKVLSSVALPELVSGLEQGTTHVAALGGMMAKQSTTFTGALSNIGDSLNQVLAGAFQPFFNVVSQGAQKLVTGLSSAAFTNFGNDVTKALNAAIAVIRFFVGYITGSGSDAIDGFSSDTQKKLDMVAGIVNQVFQTVRAVLTGAVNFIRGTVIPVAGDLARTFGPLLAAGFVIALGAVRQLVTVLGPLGDVLRSVFGFVSDHATTFQALAVAIGAVYTWSKLLALEEAVIAAVTKAWAAAQFLLDAAMDANPIGLVVLAVVGLIAGIAYLWTHSAAFRDFFIAMWNGIRDAAVAVADWVVNAWHAVINFFVALPGNIWNAITSLPGLLLQAAQAAMTAFFTAIGFGLGLIVKEWLAFPGQVWAIIQGLWNLAVSLFRTGVNNVIFIFTVLPGRLWSILWDARGRAVSAVGTLVADVGSFFAQLPGKVWAALSGLPGRVMSIVAGAEHWFFDAGVNLLKGLVNGITSVGGWVNDKIKGIAGDIASGFKHALGIGSPSRVMADEVGRWIPPGIAQGIEDTAHVAVSAIHSIMPGAPQAGTLATGAASAAASGPFFGPGSITVNMPAGTTPRQAQQAGEQVAQGIADGLQGAGLQWYLRPRAPV